MLQTDGVSRLDAKRRGETSMLRFFMNRLEALYENDFS
ncbi:hypothetical protein CM49_02306 [Paenibacillus sp. P1XP2]|jgi:hypothetical protein|nr:hypothetical protein CM49_02306 [Paenibacillus sp. P1XP2]